ncbi:MAG: hypothetical protein ACREID_01000, partial [Planctomycetota bacterium]
QEYRILPVSAPKPAARKGWQAKPDAYLLRRDLPSSWTPALFARHYLASRVHPESWAAAGNFLEAAGAMLVARNRPEVLDAVQTALERVERPSPEPLRTRFLLASAPEGAISGLRAHFQDFQVSALGSSPLLYAILPRDVSLDYVCSYLRDQGAEVAPARDVFEVELDNGAPQTLFVSTPLSQARGYEGWTQAGAGAGFPSAYGLLLDLVLLRDESGGAATAMRISSLLPHPPTVLETRDGDKARLRLYPRFLAQETGLFAELPPGAVLVVAGLVDPFSAAAGKDERGRALLLLWENPGVAAAAGTSGEPGTSRVEVPLTELLFKVRDDPGPRGDAERGFTAREPQEVLRARAAFLESLLGDGLESPDAMVDAEEGVVRVPPALGERAAEQVAALEREGARPYEVRVRAKAVRTQVVERWIQREQLAFREFDRAAVAVTDAAGAEFALNSLAGEPADVFAPGADLSAFAALGLQARHAISARTRSFPVYGSDADLATGATRLVTEGLSVVVRPFTWRGRIWAEVEIETQALENVVEESALTRAVPSYRTKAGGARVAGRVELGDAGGARTALFGRIPHPTASTPARLVEIVVTVTVRPAD